MGKNIRIALVDDHPIIRQGLRQLLESETDMEVVGEAGDAAEAMDVLVANPPDIAIFDLNLKGKNGIELIKDVRARGMNFPVLVLSVHSEMTYAERALRAGAQGYVMKEEAPEVVIGAIRSVLAGQVYVCESLASKLLSRITMGQVPQDEDAAVAALSDRELEVLEKIGQGVGTRDTSKQLGLSVSTVETYRANIKRKLDLKDGAEMARFAAEWILRQG